MLKCGVLTICFLISFTGCSRSQDNTPLKKAIFDHDYVLAQQLLSSGEDPNEKDEVGSIPLVYAVFNDDTLMLKILINHGANIHALLPPFGESILNLCV